MNYFMKILGLILALGAVLFGVLFLGITKINQQDDNLDMIQGKQTIKQDLPRRKPAVAGSFYPGDPVELEKMITDFLEGARLNDDKRRINTNQNTNDTNHEFDAILIPKILIVPHAGYVYSGQTAAYGFLKLEGRAYKRVILIGPSHTIFLEGISVFPKGYYETPLGRLEVDEELAREIIESSERISYVPAAHEQEHSLEVELPFLQVALNDFKIVPILISFDSKENIEALVGALKDQVGEETLVVVSSDLSHYPEYEAANQVDGEFIEAVLTKNIDELDRATSESMSRAYDNLDTVACGRAGIKVGMGLAEAWNLEGQLLKYMNSGDVSGDKGRVVGYASVVFYGLSVEDEVNKVNKVNNVNNNDGVPSDQVSEVDKEELLKIARGALEKYLGLKKLEIKKLETRDDAKVESEFLQRHLGAFVTLRRKDTHELRGCIGRFSPTDAPLYQVVQQMAMAAATQDIRFESVTYDELDEIEIEISVLSELKKIDDPSEIEVGKHGVEVRQGSRHGVFLPQVATENNWDLETFMGELCEHKAGIDRDAWKTGEVDLYIFTADVFGE